MTGFDERLSALEQAVASLTTERPPTGTADTPEHSTWTCDGCGYLLGTYSPAEAQLRRKYKDDIVFVKLGAGGSMTCICRRCAQPNTVTAADVETMKGSLLR